MTSSCPSPPTSRIAEGDEDGIPRRRPAVVAARCVRPRPVRDWRTGNGRLIPCGRPRCSLECRDLWARRMSAALLRNFAVLPQRISFGVRPGPPQQRECPAVGRRERVGLLLQVQAAPRDIRAQVEGQRFPRRRRRFACASLAGAGASAGIIGGSLAVVACLSEAGGGKAATMRACALAGLTPCFLRPSGNRTAARQRPSACNHTFAADMLSTLLMADSRSLPPRKCNVLAVLAFYRDAAPPFLFDSSQEGYDMPGKTFAALLPLLAVLAVVTPTGAVAGPPERPSGRMLFDAVHPCTSRRLLRRHGPSATARQAQRGSPRVDARGLLSSQPPIASACLGRAMP
jgi:hypothetical protein